MIVLKHVVLSDFEIKIGYLHKAGKYFAMRRWHRDASVSRVMKCWLVFTGDGLFEVAGQMSNFIGRVFLKNQFTRYGASVGGAHFSSSYFECIKIKYQASNPEPYTLEEDAVTQ